MQNWKFTFYTTQVRKENPSKLRKKEQQFLIITIMKDKNLYTNTEDMHRMQWR